jgi:hypothetical protein
MGPDKLHHQFHHALRVVIDDMVEAASHNRCEDSEKEDQLRLEVDELKTLIMAPREKNNHAIVNKKRKKTGGNGRRKPKKAN